MGPDKRLKQMIRIQNGVFLHIPKTGGTWLSKYFEEAGMILDRTPLGHENGSQIPKKWARDNPISFCFVRHPMRWLRSYWQCKQEVVLDRLGGPIDTIVDLSFNKFIDAVIDMLPGYVTGFFAGYTDYCHFVGKQETLRDDLVNLFRYARIPYNHSLMMSMENDNVIPSTEKYTIAQALKIMELDKKMAEQYDYNYLPMGLIKND